MAARRQPPPGVQPPSRVSRTPLSRRQIETVVSRSVAIFALVFVVQSLPAVIEQTSEMRLVWTIIIDTSVLGGIVAAGIASMAKRFVRATNGYVTISWLAAMVTWPLALLEPDVVQPERPWLWYLCTVATAAAAIAWPVWIATTALFVAPVAYGVIRLLPAGGAANPGLVLLDIVYAVLLGGAVLIIVTMLRQAAASVDAAQGTALDRYAHAVLQHATEVERVQVDAIVHDSVLTTLLSAASANTPESKKLAATMAGNAMGFLRDAAAASPDDDATVPLDELATRLGLAVEVLERPFTVTRGELGDGAISAQAAEAVYSAAVQSMVNSVQHAGGSVERRWVTITTVDGSDVLVEVGDDGDGFETSTVPSERIGLRVSIIERVANAGGEVDVRSAPGEGTVIRIVWPGRARIAAGVTDERMTERDA